MQNLTYLSTVFLFNFQVFSSLLPLYFSILSWDCGSRLNKLKTVSYNTYIGLSLISLVAFQSLHIDSLTCRFFSLSLKLTLFHQVAPRRQHALHPRHLG